MKLAPHEKKIQKNFEPGKITKHGFLGKDHRHIHDIIHADRKTLARLDVTQEAVADRLHFLMEEGKKGLEGEVDLGEVTTRVIWHRGMLPCPFGEPGLYHTAVVTVFNKKLDRSIDYSELSVHLIKKHGFFGGEGSVFRLSPKEVVEVTGLKSA